MNTANIIMAACLIILMGVAVALIVRAMRKASEADLKAQELALREAELDNREKGIEQWKAKLKARGDELDKWLAQRKHIYANFEVADNAENKPTAKTIGKSLSSKIGYALRREFPSIQTRHDDKNGGRTVYSVDFFVSDYEETV